MEKRLAKPSETLPEDFWFRHQFSGVRGGLDFGARPERVCASSGPGGNLGEDKPCGPAGQGFRHRPCKC